MIQILITSSVLILVIALTRLLLRKKVSQRLIYGLWLLAALRLLIPFQFGQWEYSLITVAQPATEQVEQAVSQPLTGSSQNALYQQLFQNYLANRPLEDAPTPPSQPIPNYEDPAVQEQPESPTLSQILTVVWISGMAALALWFLVTNLVFLVRIQKGSTVWAGERPTRVRICPNAPTPCLIGLFRPTVCLTPASIQDETALGHVLAHETTHLRHGDQFWALVRCICLCIYWFNPLVWLAAILSKRDCELACDEAVIKKLGDDQRLSYGKTLLQIAVPSRSPVHIPPSATAMNDSKKQLKERMCFIVKKRKNLLLPAICLVLVVTLTAGLTFTGCRSASDPGAASPMVPESSSDPGSVSPMAPESPSDSGSASPMTPKPSQGSHRPSSSPADISKLIDMENHPMQTSIIARDTLGLSYIEFLYASNDTVASAIAEYESSVQKLALRDTTAMGSRILYADYFGPLMLYFPVRLSDGSMKYFTKPFEAPETDIHDKAYRWFMIDLRQQVQGEDTDAYAELLTIAFFQDPDGILSYLSQWSDETVSQFAGLIAGCLDETEQETYEALLTEMMISYRVSSAVTQPKQNAIVLLRAALYPEGIAFPIVRDQGTYYTVTEVAPFSFHYSIRNTQGIPVREEALSQLPVITMLQDHVLEIRVSALDGTTQRTYYHITNDQFSQTYENAFFSDGLMVGYVTGPMDAPEINIRSIFGEYPGEVPFWHTFTSNTLASVPCPVAEAELVEDEKTGLVLVFRCYTTNPNHPVQILCRLKYGK